MSQNFSLKTPPTIRIEEATIIGQWEVTQISRCSEKSEPVPVTQRTKIHFLEEMLYIVLKNGTPSHGMWRLSESNDAKFRHSIILNDKSELGIVHLDVDELFLSDGCTEYTMIRRI